MITALLIFTAISTPSSLVWRQLLLLATLSQTFPSVVLLFSLYLVDDNPVAFVLLFCEMMQSVFMNSFCIGVIYARVSRALVHSFSLSS